MSGARAGGQISVTREGDVLHVRLDRPERLNALSAQMRDALVEVFQEQRDAPREGAARANASRPVTGRTR